MSATRPPFALPPGTSRMVSPTAGHEAILAGAAEIAPVLIMICRKSDLGILYRNGTASRWLDPGAQSDRCACSLADCIGVESATLLRNEMVLQASVLGKWSGRCMLRDVWGSEFPVAATLSHHAAEPGGREASLCFQAVRVNSSPEPEVSATSDHNLLRALLDSLPDGIYFKDLQSRFIRVSRALAQKDGTENPADLIGKTDFDRFTSEHARPAYEAEQEIIRTGQSLINLEEKETWADGRVTWVSTTKLPLHDGAGRTVGTFGISRDVTASKLADQANAELLVQLQLAQKLESIGRLAAGVAHEINTPTQFITDNTHFLTTSFGQLARFLEACRPIWQAAAHHPPLSSQAGVVAGLAQEIELDYLVGEIPQTLKQTLEGLGRVARIVRSLKEFSHPSNAERHAVDLNHVIETAITISRHEWKYVAEVVTDLDATLPPVPCVVDEFNQVILNLLVNAAHAIDSAGKNRPDGPRQGTITVRTRREGEWALIEVADTGTGIPADIRQRVFEPFFTTKEIGKGTGQGLAIAHTVIVKHHQGTIDLTSEVGRGTTFHLRLPLTIVPPPAP